MRTPDEILFRLRQELGNIGMFLRPPRLAETDRRKGSSCLPDPSQFLSCLAETPYANQILSIADNVLVHRVPLLGFEVDLGPEIRWRRDSIHETESGLAYFRRIPYLNFQKAGDHKVIWELNRHQHLVLLAQAYLLSGNRRYLEEIVCQIESWRKQNPWLRGINWTSALEVAFRALSWLWLDHLVGSQMEDEQHFALVDDLFRHGCYLERNLSIYFSPNTHLLGEAVALHALGTAYPHWPRARQWRDLGASIVDSALDRQVCEDGAYFELSTYYHVYALDFFLLHAVFRPGWQKGRPKLVKMAEFLEAMLGPSRTLPFLGDDDGGRIFHPYGPRDRFGRATLATAALLLGEESIFYETCDLYEQACWWLGASVFERGRRVPKEHGSKLFPSSGLAVMGSGRVQAIFDGGPFGEGGAGHSHSDTLSIVIREGGNEILIDPGTYTYVSDPVWRDLFRSSAAHNIVRIDSKDQAKPAGPFRWIEKPQVKLLHWQSNEQEDSVEALCLHGSGISHRRFVRFWKPNLFVILDEIEGPGGEHLIEQFWHPGLSVERIRDSCFAIGPNARLVVESSGEILVKAEESFGWRSRVFGQKEPAPVIVCRHHVPLPWRLASVIDLAGDAEFIQIRQGTKVQVDIMRGKQSPVSLQFSSSTTFTK